MLNQAIAKATQFTLKAENSSNQYDKIIMSYPNHNPPNQFPFNSPQYINWGQPPFSLPLMPAPHFGSFPQAHPPLNLLVQQQNNYFNSNFSMQGSPHQDLSRLGPISPYQNFNSWMPRPDILRSPVKEVITKKKPEVICLDDDSPVSAIVIEDSEEVVVQKIADVPKPSFQKSEVSLKKKNIETGKTEFKQIVDKSIKQKRPSDLLKGSKKDNPSKREPKIQPESQLAPVPKSPKKEEGKITKKKSIQHERFVYRLRHHEKKLMELSDCRDYCVGQIMTGPQFQAVLPSFRVFSSSRHSKLEQHTWLARKKNNLYERLQH